jgi:hypothetical protein
VVLSLVAGNRTLVRAEGSRAAYLVRGEQVEARYRTCEERLSRAREGLWEHIRKEAPDLVPTIERAPVAAVPHGYGIVPRLVADVPRPATPPRSAPASYSWPWTDRMIEREVDDLAHFETDLERAARLAPSERRAAYQKLIAGYGRISGDHHTIDAHMRYNRQWQAAIAGDKAAYDRDTGLLHAVLDRQAIRDALAIADDAGFRKSVAGIAGIDPARDRGALESELRAREEKLSHAIHGATDQIRPPPFIRVEQPAARRWIVRVPVYTDIEDAQFLKEFVSAVESIWSLRDRGDEFRVKLAITRLPPARLYAPRTPPAPGASIDLHAHLALFPRDGGVLTTGAELTHVTEGHCIVLGPHAIARHVLAHEFGHVLGFQDTYFRGYRDLGVDGYEVTEVVPDPDDIMGAPGAGLVLRHHFEKLIGHEDAQMDARGVVTRAAVPDGR